MPSSGSLRKGFSRSAKKSAREILHSTTTEANHVRRFTAGAGLLRKHDAATISAAKPLFGQTYKLLMGHPLML